ncbi:MAG TPA: TRAP transporter small permease subunit [Marinagarivorans sp.]
MTPLLERYSQLSSLGTRLNLLLGRSVSWLTLFMVVIMAAIVIIRALFNTNAIAAQELVTYLHAIVIMSASAYTLAEHGHVRVDIFYRRFTVKQQAWVDLVGSLVFLLPFAVVTTVVSWDFVARAWAIKEGSTDAGGLPAVFLLKSLLVVNGALLALQALADVLKQLATLAEIENTEPRITAHAEEHP